MAFAAFCDYHLHTKFSTDGRSALQDYVRRAKELGFTELCVTDHDDCFFPEGNKWRSDIAACYAQIDAAREEILRRDGVTVRKGVEVGMTADAAYMREISARYKAMGSDFIIASVHSVDGVDPYFPEYFEERSRARGFAEYIETALACVKNFPDFCALGHIDYPTKGCPYEENILRYEDAPDAIDALFAYLVHNGKVMEINTSVYRKACRLPGLDVLRRYVELGGEAVTLGSDAHESGAMGYRFGDAVEIAREAGLKYVATFEGLAAGYCRI